MLMLLLLLMMLREQRAAIRNPFIYTRIIRNMLIYLYNALVFCIFIYICIRNVESMLGYAMYNLGGQTNSDVADMFFVHIRFQSLHETNQNLLTEQE